MKRLPMVMSKRSTKTTIVIAISFPVIIVIILLFFQDNPPLTAQKPATKASNEKTSFKQIKERTIKIKLPSTKKQKKTLSTEEKIYILTCDEKDAENKKRVMEQFQKTDLFGNESMQKFKQSQNENERLFYILNNQKITETERLLLLKDFVNQHVDNKLSQWRMIVSCTSQISLCDERIEQSAIESDGNNAALWLNIAALRMEKKDREGSLVALEKSASLPFFNDYFSEEMSLYEQVAINNGYPDYEEIVLGSIGTYATTPIAKMDEIVNLCEKKSKNQLEIANLCIRVGENIQHYGQSYFSHVLGLALLEKVFQAQGNTLELENIKIKKDNLMKNAWSGNFAKAMELTLFDRQLLQDWYEAWKQQGEIYAQHYVIEEAIRLSKNPDYNPCPLH
ncbi:MAG TPA: hypothetical protein ENJ60_16035 [Aeromonadales bacterium]|nr:hypothetical protein [Aeromonadales bacterium]